MSFNAELERWLPADLPNRSQVLEICTRHLELIVEANNHLNLTRITTPEDAAIKHVLDSLLPWRHFEGAKTVLDAGTGAGLPGIPLAAALPQTRFILADSVSKKARFVDASVDALELGNVWVEPFRAEDVLDRYKVDVITARAMAPLLRALEYFGPAIRGGAHALLYKGPEVQAEIDDAALAAKKAKVVLRVVDRYSLPKDLGTRTLVEIRSA